MRFNRISWLFIQGWPWLVVPALIASFVQSRSSAQTGPVRSGSPEDVKVSVFFSAAKAMDLGQIKTNALKALQAKGFTVPQTASCVINIAVQGPKPGCAIMFWDFVAKQKYQVEFNGQGQVSEIYAGPMRHGTVPPNAPRPTVPEGGVKPSP